MTMDCTVKLSRQMCVGKNAIGHTHAQIKSQQMSTNDESLINMNSQYLGCDVFQNA